MTSPTDVSVIITYRCQMRCKMCGIWECPTEPEKEIKVKEKFQRQFESRYYDAILKERYGWDGIVEMVKNVYGVAG